MQIPYEQRRLLGCTGVPMLPTASKVTRCCSPALTICPACLPLSHISVIFYGHTKKSGQQASVICLLLLDDDMSSLNSTGEPYNRGDTEFSFWAISALRPPLHLPAVPEEERVHEILMPRSPHSTLLLPLFPFFVSSCSKCTKIV